MTSSKSGVRCRLPFSLSGVLASNVTASMKNCSLTLISLLRALWALLSSQLNLGTVGVVSVFVSCWRPPCSLCGLPLTSAVLRSVLAFMSFSRRSFCWSGAAFVVALVTISFGTASEVRSLSTCLSVGLASGVVGWFWLASEVRSLSTCLSVGLASGVVGWFWLASEVRSLSTCLSVGLASEVRSLFLF